MQFSKSLLATTLFFLAESVKALPLKTVTLTETEPVVTVYQTVTAGATTPTTSTSAAYTGPQTTVTQYIIGNYDDDDDASVTLPYTVTGKTTGATVTEWVYTSPEVPPIYLPTTVTEASTTYTTFHTSYFD